MRLWMRYFGRKLGRQRLIQALTDLHIMWDMGLAYTINDL